MNKETLKQMGNIILNIILIFMISFAVVKTFAKQQDYSKQIVELNSRINELEAEKLKAITDRNDLFDIWFLTMDNESYTEWVKNKDAEFMKCEKGPLSNQLIERNFYYDETPFYAHYMLLEYTKGYMLIDHNTGSVKCFKNPLINIDEDQLDCYYLCEKAPIIGGRSLVNKTDEETTLQNDIQKAIESSPLGLIEPE